MMLRRGFIAERAANFAEEIHAPGQHVALRLRRPGELTIPARLDAERLEQSHRHRGVETHYPDVQERLALLDGAQFALRSHTRLLEIEPHAPRAPRTENPVLPGLFRGVQTSERREPGLGERDIGGIKKDQSVAGRHHHLSATSLRGRQSHEARRNAVKERTPERRIGLPRHWNEDLAARSVGREPPGIAAGVNDEDAEAPEDALDRRTGVPPVRDVRRSGQAGRLSYRQFAVHHFHQAAERAAAAADAFAFGISNHEDVPDAGERAAAMSEPQLRLIGAGLGVIGRGDDEIVPGDEGLFGHG